VKKIALFVFSILFSGCAYLSQGVNVDADRYAEITPKDIFGDSTQSIVYLDQNWDRNDSVWFYNTTQGSNLMPYQIFLNLEQSNSQQPFRSRVNMERLRFLTQKKSDTNPDGLPVGFVKSRYQNEDYLGLTCAACHTGQVNYSGVGIRIDGGPSLADVENLLLELASAMTATVKDIEKFNRLATKVIGQKGNPEKEDFRRTLQGIAEDQHRYNEDSAPIHNGQYVPYGYGRLDAFGRIYNQVLSHLTPGKQNANPADAPVSYPFLWDTPQHDYVQWNGVGENHLNEKGGFLGPLARNVGEAMGVFATFDLDKKKGDKGYRSSVNVPNLVKMEAQLKELWSPIWPEEVLPKINRDLAVIGKRVYEQYRCSTCHGADGAFDRSDPNRRVIAQFSKVETIGTDPVMAVNAIAQTGFSGLFQGQKMPNGKDLFQEKTSVLPALMVAGKGVVIEPNHDKLFGVRWIERSLNFLTAFFDNPIKKTDRHVDFEIDNRMPEGLRAYKARPLNGIWATAPYLHNGSVPNLYELFLPHCAEGEKSAVVQQCRSNRFTLGSREFDPVRVGFLNADNATYKELFVFDTSLYGNSNAGHEYTSGKTAVIQQDANGSPIRNAQGKIEMEWLSKITDSERWALVEYLKTL
jgi:hypothetical protein